MKLIKKILNSVNNQRKYTIIHKNLQTSINNHHFWVDFLEMVSQLFVTKEYIFRRTKPLLAWTGRSSTAYLPELGVFNGS